MPNLKISKLPNLVIVESPSKAKTISYYLGPNYLVKASLGHIFDLPVDRPGYIVEDGFEPEWEILPKKHKLVQELKALGSKAEHIFLATDPDREGEAIAAHLFSLFPSEKKIYRIRFNEITKESILKAFQVPSSLDMNLFEAQKARRVLDRIVGYGLSPYLWNLKSKLSAGRVQSVPLRWICEREKEIQTFISEEYWDMEAEFTYKDFSFKAHLVSTNLQKKLKLDFIKNLFPNIFLKEGEQFIEQELNYEIKNIESSFNNLFPPPPFITSTLQQAAQNKLGLSVSATMKILTTLYEGLSIDGKLKGLITYPRTDSTRISETAQKMSYAYIKQKGWKIGKLIQRKSKGKVQDAHEAIRPTDISLEPQNIKNFLTEKEAQVYELIWKRYVESFLPPAKFQVIKIQLQAGEAIFEANWKVLESPGFLELEGRQKENLNLPDWKLKDICRLRKYKLEKKFTTPPSRYTEASLIEKMEKTGIGRPSTYAPTLQVLYQRKYITKQKKIIFPTELGKAVIETLVPKFSKLLEDEFTSNMEKEIDKIEQGKVQKSEFLEKFLQEFESLKKQKNLSNNNQICPSCQSGVLRKKVTKKGKLYWICSNYPSCEFMEYFTT